MESINFEKTTRDYFISCLSDPEVMNYIREKIKVSTETYNDSVLCTTDGSLKEKNYDFQNDLSKKIDEVLKIQQSIEKHLNIGMCEQIDELTDKLETQKTEHEKEIARNKEEYGKEIQKKDKLIECLQTETNESKQTIITLREEINSKNNQIINLGSKLSSYEEIIQLWEQLSELSEDNYKYLESLAGGDNMLAILSLGRDDGKIDQLWLYLRDIVVKGDIQEKQINILNSYFAFCIKVFNSTQSEEEKYVVSDVNIGDEYDVGEAIRTANSRQIGQIVKIYVKKYIRKGITKYKAIVSVE